MIKSFLIQILEGIVFLFLGVIVILGIMLGSWAGGFGGGILGLIISVIIAALFGGFTLVVLSNNELLKEIRDNTKKN